MNTTIQPFDTRDGFTRINNYVLDHIMPSLPPNAWKVLCYVMRKTTGWGKDTERLSYPTIQEGTGIKSTATLSAALKELIQLDYITVTKSGKFDAFTYSLNTDLLIDLSTLETEATLETEVAAPLETEVRPTLVSKGNKKKVFKETIKKEIVAPQQTQAKPSSPVEKPIEEKPRSPVKAMTDAWTEWKRVKEPGAVINYGQEGKAAKALVKAGWSSDQVITCANILFADAFYSSSALSLWTVAKQIGAKLRHSPPKDAPPPPAIIMDFDAIFGVSSHATH